MYVSLVCVHNQPNKAYEIQKGNTTVKRGCFKEVWYRLQGNKRKIKTWGVG